MTRTVSVVWVLALMARAASAQTFEYFGELGPEGVGGDTPDLTGLGADKDPTLVLGVRADGCETRG